MKSNMNKSKSLPPKMQIEPKFLRKEIKRLKYAIRVLEQQIGMNQNVDLKKELAALKKELEKFSLNKDRIHGLDRISDVKQIKQYKEMPKDAKVIDLLSKRKKSLHDKLNAPDEVWCTDRKIRTKKQAEAWRIQKPKSA